MADLPELLHRRLRERGESLATAESLTGGRLASALTDVPGASATYLGGVIAYATDLKRDLLGVPGALISTHGVVSAECALAMAMGVRDLAGATFGISTTGVAGPEQQEDKPVGTVHVAIVGPDVRRSLALELPGRRTAIQDATVRRALEAMWAILRGEETPLG